MSTIAVDRTGPAARPAGLAMTSWERWGTMGNDSRHSLSADFFSVCDLSGGLRVVAGAGAANLRQAFCRSDFFFRTLINSVVFIVVSVNVLKGTLRQDAGGCWVEAQGSRWPVAASVQGDDGQAVHFGIRPADLAISAHGNGIAARVIVVEPTGAETELLLQVGNEKLIVVMHGRTSVRPDESVMLEIAAGKAHVFDSASGSGIRLE